MTFLIVLAIIIVIFALVLSISATLTVIYDNKWTVKLKVLWFEFDIKLAEILQKLLFSDKKTKENKEKAKKKKKEKSNQPAEEKPAVKKERQGDKEPKPNYFKKLWDEEGIVGIFNLISNVSQSASKAVKILIKGFHIYSLYVKIIVGAPDAALAAMQYGKICSYYYPVKGIITTNLTVDNYDEFIAPDFIAEENEYEFQLIASLSIYTIVKCALAAVAEFVKTAVKN
ncbi:MAG: hypothetical protein LUH82_00790 [Clostridiales bacterium]|nr:hypothetical protein [Clostridiales bacterium]